MPGGRWSAEECEKRALLEQGVAVVVNMRRLPSISSFSRAVWRTEGAVLSGPAGVVTAASAARP